VLEIFIHFIQFLLYEFVLQLSIEVLLRDLLALAKIERLAFPEWLMRLFDLSDLINELVDVAYGLYLDEDIFVCEIAVQKCKFSFCSSQLLLQPLHLLAIAHLH
jgi:hypothetical protein